MTTCEENYNRVIYSMTLNPEVFVAKRIVFMRSIVENFFCQLWCFEELIVHCMKAGSDTYWIHMYFVVFFLVPNLWPETYWEYESGSRSKEMDQNYPTIPYLFLDLLTFVPTVVIVYCILHVKFYLFLMEKVWPGFGSALLKRCIRFRIESNADPQQLGSNHTL